MLVGSRYRADLDLAAKFDVTGGGAAALGLAGTLVPAGRSVAEARLRGVSWLAATAATARDGVAPSGPPVAVYRSEVGDTFEVTVGFPVAHAPASGALARVQLPAGPVVQAMHAGSYETLADTYGRLGDWFADRHLQPPPLMWEEYLVGPDQGGPVGCRTRVVFLLARPVAGVYVLREGRVTWKPALDVDRVILGGQLVAATALLVARSVIPKLQRNGRLRLWQRR